MRRAAVYFFYDADGVADRYVQCMLDGIAGCLDTLVVVSNGPLTPESRALFERYAGVCPRFHLLIRENRGFDVWAYKEAMALLGWETIGGYDELLLFNHTIMGPVYPFERVFEEMDARDVDFWGLNIHYGAKEDPFGSSPFGYLPPHLQSHFIAFRSRLTRSEAFHSYWDNMPEIRSYGDSVGLHESFMTKHFADMGYRWAAFVEADALKAFTPYPLLDLPIAVLRRYRCPVFKRKSFFVEDWHYVGRGGCAATGARLFRYLEENTAYDVSMILENIARTCRKGAYATQLGLLRALPDARHDDGMQPPKLGVFYDPGDYEAALDLEQYALPPGTRVHRGGGPRSWDNLFTGADAKYEDYDAVFVVHPPAEADADARYGLLEQIDLALYEFFGGASGLSGTLRLLNERPHAALVTPLRPIAQFQKLFWAYQEVGRAPERFPTRELPQGAGLGVFLVRTACLSPADGERILDFVRDPDYDGTLLDILLSDTLQKRGLLTVCAGGAFSPFCNQRAAELETRSFGDLVAKQMDELRAEIAQRDARIVERDAHIQELEARIVELTTPKPLPQRVKSWLKGRR